MTVIEEMGLRAKNAAKILRTADPENDAEFLLRRGSRISPSAPEGVSSVPHRTDPGDAA